VGQVRCDGVGARRGIRAHRRVIAAFLAGIAVIAASALTSFAAAGDGGSGMPAGNLPGWHRVMAQDFDTPVPLGSFPGPAYRSSFYVYDGFADTSGQGLYSPAKVLSVRNGSLDWNLHTESGRPLVAAVVPEVPGTGWGQTYGRYSVRFRSGIAAGYKVAFLLWPDSGNWAEGEIDFPEVSALDAGSRIYANLYPAGRPDLTGGSAGFQSRVAAAASGWHVATIEWSRGRLRYILDGATLGTTTVGVPATPMHWVLQVETAIGARPPASVTGHVDVDWVTIYSRD
jgi:hypothetical protein